MRNMEQKMRNMEEEQKNEAYGGGTKNGEVMHRGLGEDRRRKKRT